MMKEIIPEVPVDMIFRLQYKPSAMKNMGSLLIIAGISILIVGLMLRFGGIPLGRLPGDIRIAKPGMGFYFPITTCIIFSILISLILYLYRHFR
jgi:hypothetical protein